jgi:4'-phosphopantetheinyl transferase
VWWIPLSSLDWVRSESILSPEERAQAARFRFEQHACRFRASHTALRLILEQYLRQPAHSIRLIGGPSGKPFIEGAREIHFNLSHADEVALVAVSCDVEVGVDLEAIRFDVRVQEMAAFFNDRELEMLYQATTAETRVTLLFRFWTRKEAVLKADGSGFDIEPRNIDVSHAPEELVRVDSGGQQLWKVDNLDVAHGYAGALAASAGAWQVRWRRFADLSLL